MSFAAVLLVALCAVSPSFAGEAGPDSTQPAASGQSSAKGMSEAALPESEPLYVSPTRRDRIGRILAPVMINGQGPFRFVLDTGATHSVVSVHLVGRLGLTVSADSMVSLSGVTGTAMVATVHIEKFQAGELIMEKLDMPVISSVLPGADGVLGVQGLEDKRIVVDFTRDQIQILRSRGNLSRDGYLKMPVKLGFNRLLLANARVGRVSVKAIIDTGAEHTLGNNALRQALKVGTGSHDAPTIIGVQGVTAAIQSGDLATAPTIRLGGMDVTQVAVAFGDMHVFDVWGLQQEPALLIGMDVLGILDMIVIDYKRQEVHFKPRYRGPRILVLE